MVEVDLMTEDEIHAAIRVRQARIGVHYDAIAMLQDEIEELENELE